MTKATISCVKCRSTGVVAVSSYNYTNASCKACKGTGLFSVLLEKEADRISIKTKNHFADVAVSKETYAQYIINRASR